MTPARCGGDLRGLRGVSPRSCCPGRAGPTGPRPCGRPRGSAIWPRWATSPCTECCCASASTRRRCPCSGPLWWRSICAAALLRARQLTRQGRPGHAAVLVGCATVAASPVSWTHHQVWPVLAAMLLIGASGVTQRAAGAALLAAMVVSLGAVLSPVLDAAGRAVPLRERPRRRGVPAVPGRLRRCRGRRQRTSSRPAAGGRGWLRVGVTATVAVAFFAVQPLPAGADPTFKAYALDDVVNPRYFFVCRGPAECAAYATDAPVTFGTRAEKTKVRVNGVVSPQVTRLEYFSAPGGAPRAIPLLAAYPGSADLLVPFGDDGPGSARRVRLGRAADRQLRRGTRRRPPHDHPVGDRGEEAAALLSGWRRPGRRAPSRRRPGPGAPSRSGSRSRCVPYAGVSGW